MKTLVSMNPDGRLTVPAALRRELGVEGAGEFEIELRGNELVLRPVLVLPREDAWAYTPAHRELLRRAHDDSREGRFRTLDEADLENLAG